MRLPRLELEEEAYRVYKTGIAFYDAARLVGVAHLFFGTASAEVVDKGACWDVSGVRVNRDNEQMIWVIERGKQVSHQFSQKNTEIMKAFTQLGNCSKEFKGVPIMGRGMGRYPAALAELDTALVRSTRGSDPLSNHFVLSQVERRHVPIEKEFKVDWGDFLAASMGFSFAAIARSRNSRAYILPIFRERFVLSGFLEFERRFYHVAGEVVAKVYAAISILLQLMKRSVPVSDFVHSTVTGRNISFSSGYLELEQLCNLWWNAVQKKEEGVLYLLRQIRQFLRETSSQSTSQQVQSLARWVAEFVANPNVNALTMIEHLKARIRATSQGQNFQGASAANRLLNRPELIMEAGKMLQGELPEVPWQVSEALAKALAFDERGWMNQLTRLENAPNFSQFIQQVEHIVSRGYYREQQERGQPQNIQKTLMRARGLANTMREMSRPLQDEKSFRAWKAIFLLDVLSRARSRVEEPEGEGTVPETTPLAAAVQISKEG